ncbi:MAG: DUF2953 domain-containing protein [Saccharospirillum sp.]
MVLVWLLLALVSVLVALLAIPVEWDFSIRLQAGLREGRSQVRWLFGLVRVRTDGSPGEKAKTKPKTKKPRKTGEKRRKHSPLAAARVEGFIGRVITLIRRLLSSIEIQRLNLQARLGLGDAADTGRLWAFIGPLSVLLAQTKAARVSIEPDFHEARLDFNSDGRIRVVPLKLVWLVLGFALSRTTYRAWRAIKAGT